MSDAVIITSIICITLLGLGVLAFLRDLYKENNLVIHGVPSRKEKE